MDTATMEHETKQETNTMQINVPVRALKAMAVLSAKSDTRYMLNGVLIEVTANDTRLVATDGRVLGVYRVHAPENAVALGTTEKVSFIIPRTDIDRLKPKQHDEGALITLENAASQSNPCKIETTTQVIVFEAVDGQFPDYRRVVKSAGKPSGETAQFNPGLLARFQAFGRVALRKKRDDAVYLSVAHNGNGPMIVNVDSMNQVKRMNDEFYGVLMPWRQEPAVLPAWANS